MPVLDALCVSLGVCVLERVSVALGVPLCVGVAVCVDVGLHTVLAARRYKLGKADVALQLPTVPFGLEKAPVATPKPV